MRVLAVSIEDAECLVTSKLGCLPVTTRRDVPFGDYPAHLADPVSHGVTSRCGLILASLESLYCNAKIFPLPSVALMEGKNNRGSPRQTLRVQIGKPARDACVGEFGLLSGLPIIKTPAQGPRRNRDDAQGFTVDDTGCLVIKRPHLDSTGGFLHHVTLIDRLNPRDATGCSAAANKRNILGVCPAERHR